MNQIDELVLSGLDWVVNQIDLLKNKTNSENTPATADNAWISTTKQLPPTKTEVLVYAVNFVSNKPYMVKTYLKADAPNLEYPEVYHNWQDIENCDSVLFWQPISENMNLNAPILQAVRQPLTTASPKDLRIALEFVHHLKMSGIDFVPVPVTSQEQKKELLIMFEKALQELEQKANE